MEHNNTAIVLSAGKGKRMQSKIHKQYLLIDDKPVIYYSLKAFEDSFIDSVVLVVGKDEEEYCRKEIVEKYGFTKVKAIVQGGKERYHSVYNGINAICWDCDYVYIHDGARPFVTQEILKRVYEQVVKTNACVIGMPSKDTVKIADNDGYVSTTPKRDLVWTVQTPQVFSYSLIKDAYAQLKEQEETILEQGITITDDAMVVEYFKKIPVKLVEGSYQNIKITTPEDLKIAEILKK